MGRGNTTIMGNVHAMLFVEGTPDQIRAEAGKCLGIAQGGARYVVWNNSENHINSTFNEGIMFLIIWKWVISSV